jgi:hypothetical protein
MGVVSGRGMRRESRTIPVFPGQKQIPRYARDDNAGLSQQLAKIEDSFGNPEVI